MKPSDVTPDEFKQWRLRQGWSQKYSAKRLGLSTNMVGMYERGQRKEGAVVVPVVVALAMSALDKGLRPWAEK